MATNEARATVRESAERWRARVVGDVVPWVVVRVVFTRSRPVTPHTITPGLRPAEAAWMIRKLGVRLRIHGIAASPTSKQDVMR